MINTTTTHTYLFDEIVMGQGVAEAWAIADAASRTPALPIVRRLLLDELRILLGEVLFDQWVWDSSEAGVVPDLTEYLSIRAAVA